MVVPRDFIFELPSDADPLSLAPLMCAGIIGYRTMKLGVEDGHKRVGLWGFGASAHIVIQLLKYFGKKVFVFSRSPEHLKLAEELGADWIGNYYDIPPEKLDSSLTFAPSTEIVARSIQLTRRGGKIAVNAIYLDKGLQVPFNDIYGEKQILIVSNYTRDDAREFLKLAHQIPVRTEYQVISLDEVFKGIELMRERKQRTSVVVNMEA